MTEITRILSEIESGDPAAADRLLPLVYQELRKLAGLRMAAESPDHTLQPTALVHEAWLRLVGGEESRPWNGRGHFFGAAAEAMRRILVEHARRKRGPRHGGNHKRVSIQEIPELTDERADEILSVSDALAEVENESPQAAQLVKLRYFGGMSHQEAAEALGISRSTADRYWAYAKAALFAALRDPQS